MARVLLLLPTATYRAADFLTAARTLGAEVVVASDRRLVSIGDTQLTLDLRRPEVAAEAIAAVAAERPLDAVVAVDDQGVRAAALAAERLGLFGNPLEAAAATRDKAAMRRALAAAGVPQPEHRTVGPSGDSAAVAAEVGLPCVVKPLSLSASRGVIRADDPRAAAAAAARVRAILAEAGEDPEGPLLIERYVPGAEVAVEGLLRASALEPLAVFDKPDALEGPYFEETIFTAPSRLPGEIVAAVTRTTADACAALGLREGPVHAELRVHGGRVCVLELAARSIGGLCSRSLRFGVGVSLEEVILRHALGLPLGDLRREAAASGVMMLPIPRAGVLREVPASGLAMNPNAHLHFIVAELEQRRALGRRRAGGQRHAHRSSNRVDPLPELDEIVQLGGRSSRTRTRSSMSSWRRWRRTCPTGRGTRSR